MESIREGWLIKSPPEKRTQGRWKLFRAKWRRRYFVLYAPPAADIIPGMCAAILDYYGGKNLRHKHGTIDLTRCEEVLSQLDATFYQNIFGLRTKHKNRDRTYYLVADTEADMNEWVSSLCFVLGMKENVQDPVVSPPSAPLPQPPRISLPSPTASMCNSAPSLPPPRSETLPFLHRGGRRVPNHTRVQSLPGINERMNGDLEEWQNGQPPNRTSRPPPPSAPPVIGPRDNHLTLRFVPPPPTGAIQRRSCILSTIPDRLVFEEPSNPENSTEYDHPRQSYYQRTPSSAESNNNKFGALRFTPDGLYNVPNRGAYRGAGQECPYKIPLGHSTGFSDADDFRYDIPASARMSYDVPAKCLGQHSLSGEHYDVPQSGAQVSARVRSPSPNGVDPADVIGSSHLLSVLQSLIDELPTLSGCGNGAATGDRVPKTPHYCNMEGEQGGCLDGRISSRELLSLSPPVPGSGSGSGSVEMVQHSYINAANGNHAERLTSVSSSSSSPADGKCQYAKPRDVARHPAYSPVPTANDPICFTHRSKSFKRTQESLQNDPIPLPIKRISEVDDSSSISDDDETCNNSSCGPDSAVQPKPSIYDIVPLPNRQNLFCAPQVPKDSEVIKYLDLDLEDGSVPEKSSAAGKPFEPLGNATGVHYKEIDWCKTNALTETRREVENTRRTGERTLGD